MLLLRDTRLGRAIRKLHAFISPAHIGLVRMRLATSRCSVSKAMVHVARCGKKSWAKHVVHDGGPGAGKDAAVNGLGGGKTLYKAAETARTADARTSSTNKDGDTRCDFAEQP